MDPASILLASDLIKEQPSKKRGRPTILDEKITTRHELLAHYRKVRSIPKTAEFFQIGETTVKKYLKGNTNPVGRPVQPQSWNAKVRRPVHMWFVQHRRDALPNDLKLLSEMSGFSPRTIDRYFQARRRAVLDFIAAQIPLQETGEVFIDIFEQNVPTSLVTSFTYQVNKYTLLITFKCLLKNGSLKTIELPFSDYHKLSQKWIQ